MKHKKILLVDSDMILLEELQEVLVQEGFDVTVATDGKKGVEKFLQWNPSLVLMSLVLPVMDGIEACMEMRARGGGKNTLILFYTSHGEDYSQIAGFNAGADDYIVKPIKMKVLVSRIKAMLDRLDKRSVDIQKRYDPGIRIDRDRYMVVKDGLEISLPRKEFELVALLFSSPRKVFTRQEISKIIWGHDLVTRNRTIDVHIRHIRKKLGDGHVKTFKGIGYSFEF